MYLGLDVGGTHTDAVLLDGRHIVSSYKTPTEHSNLLVSMTKAIDEVTRGVSKEKIQRINLSTTLSTNAIVEKKLERVGVIVSAGPGVNALNYKIGDDFFIIDGSINHRGTQIKALDLDQVDNARKKADGERIRVFAAVTKFSTRNPDHEMLINDRLGSSAEYITMGHKLSGQLSFPRRIATAYYNSSVWRIYNDFADAIEMTLQNLGIRAPICILKADGGTIPLSHSRNIPVESILSGPAASVMGIIAICDIREDSIILDIGGTTTDIAVFASGTPVIEKDGIVLEGNPTLVRSLQTRSIGIAGDSVIKILDKKNIIAGPERLGPAMAIGGSAPTLIDALNNIGNLNYGDVEASINGMNKLAGTYSLSAEYVSNAALQYAVAMIQKEVESLVMEINSKPVYTIHEMLENKRIIPKKIFAMGGPAQAFANLVKHKFGIDVIVPANFEVANAIGAALAKTTFELELFADTSKGFLLIPNIEVKESIPKTYTLENAEEDAKKFLVEHIKKLGVEVQSSDIEITESSSFKMVSGYYSSGRDIRVKCQIKPGVVVKLSNGKGCL